MLKKLKNKKLEFISGKNALFIYLFWISLILFSAIFIINTIVLFINPDQISHYKTNDVIFLGAYYLSISSKTMYLSWYPYLIGLLIIFNTIVNCFAYWWLKTKSFYASVNHYSLMIIFISSIVIAIVFFVINMFNRPLINFNNLDLVQNGWNPNPATASMIQFNYVYDISFLNDANKSCYLTLNKFSVIWIISIAVSLVIYISSFISFMYLKQASFAIIYFS